MRLGRSARSSFAPPKAVREGGGACMVPARTPRGDRAIRGEGVANLRNAQQTQGVQRMPFWGETPVILYGGLGAALPWLAHLVGDFFPMI